MYYYGVQIEPQFGYSFQDIYGIVNFAEQKGFTHAWFSDHFMLDEKSDETFCIECFTAMMAALSKTKKLRVGSLVFSNSYRYPAVLAKQIASLDHFSSGRVEIGYGAGWKQLEYESYGIPFPSTKTRIKQLEEGIQVLKKLWTEKTPSFNGKYYNLKNAISYPKPLQKPHPPLFVGSMKGGDKVLEIAVKHATGINVAWSFSPEEWEDMINRANILAEKHGRDMKNFVFSYGAWTKIFQDEKEKHEFYQKIGERRGISASEAMERYSGALHGTIEEIREKLEEYKKLGITYFIFMFPYKEEKKYIEVFEKEIL